MYPLSKEAPTYNTSHPLNEQKIATTNLPNMAFYLPFSGAVEHAGSGSYFLALFFYKQLSYRFCWERLMQAVESLYMWNTALPLTRTMMTFWNILKRHLPSVKLRLLWPTLITIMENNLCFLDTSSSQNLLRCQIYNDIKLCLLFAQGDCYKYYLRERIFIKHKKQTEFYIYFKVFVPEFSFSCLHKGNVETFQIFLD